MMIHKCDICFKELSSDNISRIRIAIDNNIVREQEVCPKCKDDFISIAKSFYSGS